ncbi:hypothetical protein CLOM_g24098 [Closterium sp. NIES-68]|nr:hypothetical protein CLOM_g24098 [Closterium sp. NIES-68]
MPSGDHSAQGVGPEGRSQVVAAVYFKNSINRYWRARRETQGISDEEKPVLRARLLDLIADENSQVAVQLAVLVAKIARIDYPREWPELFPTLVQKLQTQDPLLTQRAYLVLNHVLKELSTKRLSVDQRTFAQVTSQLFEPTWAHWVQDTGSLLQGLKALGDAGSDQAAAAAAAGALMLLCERWLLCVKTLRRMLVFGFPSDFKSVQEVPVLEQVVPAFLEAAQSLLNFRTLSQVNPALQPLRTFLSRASVKLLKTLVASHELHPFSFASKSVLLPTLNFCYNQVTTTDPTSPPASSSPSPSTPAAQSSPAAAAAAAAPGAADTPASPSASAHSLFLIECMLFLQSVLRCVAYKQNATGHVVGAAQPSMEEMRGKLSGMARQQLQSFFSQEKVVVLGSVLVQRYLVLTAADLEEWGSDPEVFYHEQGAVQWKDKLRPCAEALLLLLFEQFKEVLSPALIDMLRQCIEASPPPASPDADVPVTPALLLKDACYDAVGVACYDLHDVVDFKSWFTSALLPDMACRHPNARILRRRAAWMVGQWVSKVEGDLCVPAYQALISLLADADLVVQLTAVASLRSLIDDVHFYEDQFAPFLDTAVQLLFCCLQQVSEFDSQLQVVNVVSLIIERMGGEDRPPG